MSCAAGPDSLGVRCTVSWNAASTMTKILLPPPRILPVDLTGMIHRGIRVAFRRPSYLDRMDHRRHDHCCYPGNWTADDSGSCSGGNCSAKGSPFDDAEDYVILEIQQLRSCDLVRRPDPDEDSRAYRRRLVVAAPWKPLPWPRPALYPKGVLRNRLRPDLPNDPRPVPTADKRPHLPRGSTMAVPGVDGYL